MPIHNRMEMMIIILLGVALFTAFEKYQKYSSRKGERKYRIENSYNSNHSITPEVDHRQNLGNNIRKQFNCELIDMQTNRAMQRLDNYDPSSRKKITASYAKQPGTLFFYSDNTLRYVPNSKKDSLLARDILTNRPISFMSPEEFVKTIVENYSLLEGIGIESNEIVGISSGDKDIKKHIKNLDLVGKTNYTTPEYKVTIVSEQDGEVSEESTYISLGSVVGNPHYEYNYKAGISIRPVEYVQELGKRRTYLMPEYFLTNKAPNTIKYPENQYYYSVWLESDIKNANDSRIVQVFFLNEDDRQSFIQEYNSLPKNNN